MSPHDFCGMPVYLTEALADRVQVRFPRSKKKRIRRKWAKRPENWRSVPRREVLMVGDSLHVHPAYFPELCRELNVRTEAAADRLTRRFEAGVADAGPAKRFVNEEVTLDGLLGVMQKAARSSGREWRLTDVLRPGYVPPLSMPTVPSPDDRPAFKSVTYDFKPLYHHQFVITGCHA